MAKDPCVRPEDYRPPENAQELITRYAAGERYFAGAEMPDGSSFVGVNLSGCNFEESVDTHLF